MPLHKRCMKAILRFLVTESNCYSPEACDYCVDWSARQLKGIPGWGDEEGGA